MARWGREDVNHFFLKHVLQFSTKRTKARSVEIYIEKNASNVIYFLNDYLKKLN